MGRTLLLAFDTKINEEQLATTTVQVACCRFTRGKIYPCSDTYDAPNTRVWKIFEKNWPAAIEIMFLFRLLRLVRSKYWSHQMTHDRSTERLVHSFSLLWLILMIWNARNLRFKNFTRRIVISLNSCNGNIGALFLKLRYTFLSNFGSPTAESILAQKIKLFHKFTFMITYANS